MTKGKDKNPKKERKMKNYKIGDKVEFWVFNVLSGDYKEEGIIEGNHKAIERLDPIAYEECSDDLFLIKSKDVYGNTQRHVVYEQDIISKKEEQ